MEADNKRNYRLGIALSGGGVRGFAHLGALQAMNERGIYPDMISGTSAGSLAGVFYADGYRPDEIYNMFRNIKFSEVAGTTIPHGGLFKTKKFHSFLEKYLRAKTFEELTYPLKVIASDIEYGKIKIFAEGELLPAVIASCTVPIVFTPVEIDGHFYVDGGLFMNFPVSVIRPHCTKVIGVNVSPAITMKYEESLKYMIERTMNYMVGSNTASERKACDFLIESREVSAYSIFDFKYIDTIYEKGYVTAAAYLDTYKDEIKREPPKQKPPKKLKDTISAIISSLRKT